MKPGEVTRALERWCKDRKDEEYWINIKKRHVDFLKVHPFEDGNGRVGRILMNIERLRSGMDILIIHPGKEQQRYYNWFN